MNEEQKDLLARYVQAFTAYDIQSLVALLQEEATASMPPFPLWLQGREDIGKWHIGPGHECNGSVLLPIEVNGSAAFAHYKPAARWPPTVRHPGARAHRRPDLEDHLLPGYRPVSAVRASRPDSTALKQPAGAPGRKLGRSSVGLGTPAVEAVGVAVVVRRRRPTRWQRTRRWRAGRAGRRSKLSCWWDAEPSSWDARGRREVAPITIHPVPGWEYRARRERGRCPKRLRLQRRWRRDCQRRLVPDGVRVLRRRFTAIQHGDRVEIGVRQAEIEDVQVLGQPGRCRRLGHRRDAQLDVPMQDHLRR